MSDVFSYADASSNQRVENRSLATHDINGAYSRKNTNTQVVMDNSAAGVRNGSPKRKNESSVFSHLTDNYKEGLKRKDIPKPKAVNNIFAS